ALGVWWADRLRPNWLVRAVRAGSDASFGIYLAHPLVLQGLLAIAGITGLLPWILQLPGRNALAIGLLGALPLVVAITRPAVWLPRRTPLSLPFSGRQAERTPRRSPTLAVEGMRTLALGLAVAGAVSWLDLSSVRQAAPGAASGGVLPPPPP